MSRTTGQYDCLEWERDALREAYQVETNYGPRFILEPKDDSAEAYRDMQDFVDTVKNKRLQELLWVALNGKGAFRRFKDVLTDYPDEKERWYDFKEARLAERVLEWLESEGIEPET